MIPDFFKYLFTHFTSYRWGVYKTFTDYNLNDAWDSFGWIVFSMLIAIMFFNIILFILITHNEDEIPILSVYIPMIFAYLIINCIIHIVIFLILFSFFSFAGIIIIFPIYAIVHAAMGCNHMKGTFGLMGFTYHYSDHISKYILHKKELKEKYNEYLLNNF